MTHDNPPDPAVGEEGEVWRDIPLARPGYQVSNLGRVRSCRQSLRYGDDPVRWQLLKPHRHRDGYPGYKLRMPSGRDRNWFAHRLVVAAFLGPRPTPDAVVRHLDGNPDNNTVANLVYGTAAENQRDMVRHGRSLPGEKSGRAVLTREQVLEVVRLRKATGLSHSRIASQFGVCPGTIAWILSGKSWGSVTGLTPKVVGHG